MPTPQANALALAVVLLASLLAGCAGGPGSQGGGRASPPPELAGQVLGRSARLLIYQSAPGETLGQLARHFLGSEDLGWVIGDFNHLSRPDPAMPLVVPLAPFNPPGVYSDRYQTVPILCYHRFGTSAPNKMTVSANAFAAQLAWLAQNGYHVLRLSQLEAWLAGKQALPLRSVVITVDDGYASFYRHAFPLLKRHGFAATLFVYTDFVGAADAASWAELKEMVDSGLVDVQSHSRTHRNLIERPATEADERYERTLADEIRTPRELLERKLGSPQQHYAYPYGDANETTLALLSRQQYRLAVTVNPGGNAFYAQPLMLRRTMIYGDMSLEAFKARLQISRETGAR